VNINVRFSLHAAGDVVERHVVDAHAASTLEPGLPRLLGHDEIAIDHVQEETTGGNALNTLCNTSRFFSSSKEPKLVFQE
jgi:hypothetical protein